MFRKLEKVLLVCFLVVVTVSFSSAAVAALSYDEARGNEHLRSEYVEQFIEEYPPPIDLVDVEYANKDSQTATMTVGYRPFWIGDLEVKLGLTLTIYPGAFEEYSNKDDFISTIYHEYNHLRALSRDKVVEKDNFYMVSNNEKTLTQLTNLNFNSKDSKFKIYSDIIEDLKWSDILNLNNYDSERLKSFNLAEKRNILSYFVRRPVMEMLAIEEEIYRHQFGLKPSVQFRQARYFTYSYYYKIAMNSLKSLNASPKLTNTIINLFWRDWIGTWTNEKKENNIIEQAINN